MSQMIEELSNLSWLAIRLSFHVIAYSIFIINFLYDARATTESHTYMQPKYGDETQKG